MGGRWRERGSRLCGIVLLLGMSCFTQPVREPIRQERATEIDDPPAVLEHAVVSEVPRVAEEPRIEARTVSMFAVPAGWRSTARRLRIRSPRPPDAPSNVELAVPWHPDPSVSWHLQGILRALIDETSLYGQPLWCAVPLATEKLVSVRCEYFEEPTRDSVEAQAFAAHYAIIDGRIEPFRIEDAIDGDIHAEERLRVACRRAGASDPDECIAHAENSWAMGPRGLVTSVSDLQRRTTRTRVELPYAELDGRIRAGSPARAFFEGVPTREVPAPVGARRAQTRMHWALSEVGSEATLSRRWISLPPADRALVRFAHLGSGASQLYLHEGVPEDARRIAALFGSTAEQRPLFAERSGPRRSRMPVETELRAEDHGYGEVLRTLPAAALLVEPDEPDGSTYATVIAADYLRGFAEEQALEAYDGCEPDPSSFLATLRPRERDTARHTLVMAMPTIWIGGRSSDAVLFAAETAGDSVVALYESGGDCRVGDAIAQIRGPGRWTRIGLPNTRARGGNTVLAAILDTGEPLLRARLQARTGEPLDVDIARDAVASMTIDEGGALLTVPDGPRVSWGEGGFVQE